MMKLSLVVVAFLSLGQVADVPKVVPDYSKVDHATLVMVATNQHKRLIAAALHDKDEDVHNLIAMRERLAELENRAKSIRARMVALEPNLPAPATIDVESVEVKNSDVERWMAVIFQIEGALFIVNSATQDEDKLTIKVTNSWHTTDYQSRLQTAQLLWQLWAKIRAPESVDRARIEITDYNGNRVGGSRVWGGSLIWVKE